MRRDLWDQPYRSLDWVTPSDFSLQLQGHLQCVQGKPPAVKELRQSFTLLRTKLGKALGKGTMEVVVGLPVYVDTVTRQEILEELERADFTVLSMVRQPALASIVLDRYRPRNQDGSFYTLMAIDYNRASLDLAITPSAHGASDVLAHISHPELGEDAINLSVAQLVLDEHMRLNATLQDQYSLPIAAAKDIRKEFSLTNDPAEFKQRTSQDYIGYKNLHDMERTHHAKIHKALENFVDKYGAQTGPASDLGVLLNDDSLLMISGDASDGSFAGLRRKLEEHEVKWPLAGVKGAPTPMRVAAKGAAIEAKRRQLYNDLEDDTRLLEKAKERLLKVNDQRRFEYMVPHIF